MGKTLYIGYRGKSSGEVISKLDSENNDILFLKGKNKTDFKYVGGLLFDGEYDKVIIFGQKHGLVNKISLETAAVYRKEEVCTNFDISSICNVFDKCLINYQISKSPGKTFSNKIYDFVLDYVYKMKPEIKVLLIQLPNLEKFPGIARFIEVIKQV